MIFVGDILTKDISGLLNREMYLKNSERAAAHCTSAVATCAEGINLTTIDRSTASAYIGPKPGTAVELSVVHILAGLLRFCSDNHLCWTKTIVPARTISNTPDTRILHSAS